MPSDPSHPQGIIYIPICHFLFHPFESRNCLKPNEGEGLQVSFFQVRGRRAHTLTYVTEPETRRKGTRCALILRLVDDKGLAPLAQPLHYLAQPRLGILVPFCFPLAALSRRGGEMTHCVISFSARSSPFFRTSP